MAGESLAFCLEDIFQSRISTSPQLAGLRGCRSVMPRERELCAYASFPVSKITDRCQIRLRHTSDYSYIVHQSKHWNAIGNYVKGAHEIDNSGHYHENRVGRCAVAAGRPSAEHANEYLKGLPW